MISLICGLQKDDIITYLQNSNRLIDIENKLMATRGQRWAAAAAAKSLQSCPTLRDPIDGSPPGSPIPGFSRQEHWSGLPFPSPAHESEK